MDEAGDLAFMSRTGTPMDPNNLHTRTLTPGGAGGRRVVGGFHAFRHFCASQLIADGRNIVQVSRWLGHHSPSFTLDVYAHLLDESVGEALALSPGGSSSASSHSVRRTCSAFVSLRPLGSFSWRWQRRLSRF